MSHQDDRYDALITAVTIALLALLWLLFAATGHAKARLYINANSIDGIRVLSCGPITNHVAECKTRVHFKDDLVSIKPTTAQLNANQITAEVQ